ncbi:LysM peptidoglycan-binding domain-containing protein [Nocardia sp. NBC_01009]|uniref:LysM peptidoglycan-binding domain-containing protein n=1 Tax=Nocardia sp. NBC_01009 TaxID=2975996 RepID=UPI003869A7F0|nr:LysM peptidoglycan-binding domain-containing protein [Nocardia sp. NBC_01009]
MPRIYTVEHGDTLFGIALQFYGDGMKFPIVAQANGIANPDLIFPGQNLQIPDLAPPPPPPPPRRPPAPGPEPEPPPPPILFRLLRPTDLLNLRCEAIGCRIRTDEGPPVPAMTTHTVSPDDTLWDLAQRFYGDPRLFPLIAAANQIPNPNRIFPGQVLVIPPRPAPPRPAPPFTHTVISGDTLWDLAERFYGDPFKYHLITAANDIGNPHAIFPDQVLVIPGLSGQPGPTPDHPRGSRLVAVTEDAHIIIRFGVQNLHEEATFTGAPEPTVARARAADDSRVVFELPKGTELPFTVSGALSTLGLRVPPLAVPRLKDGQRRPPEATVPLAVPAPDQTAIEAPYRLDLIDDPGTDEPTLSGTTAIVVDHHIQEHERGSLFTLQDGGHKVGKRISEIDVRTAIHTLPDTKARTVHYRLHGISRYREFFLPDELPSADDEASAGNEVAVNIPSSAPPLPPVVRDVIPMFQWEQTTEPEHPFAVRRIRRSGVRIWLDRPWYSSGDGEMLAILTTGDAELAKGKDDEVSLWARDPILAGPEMQNTYEVPVLSAWEQRAVQLTLVPQDKPGRPVAHVVRERKSDKPEDRDKVINAYRSAPSFIGSASAGSSTWSWTPPTRSGRSCVCRSPDINPTRFRAWRSPRSSLRTSYSCHQSGSER